MDQAALMGDPSQREMSSIDFRTLGHGARMVGEQMAPVIEPVNV
jgi:hypothetical protein